ncbi:MAG: nucleoside hydrolase [Meiothermus sp.]|uniref:nucleoside hydrolase n=1 Tax=Meiothermus sp. TaxID=1955249 RepID=UPI0025CC2D0F|nr:nucleoside hydrolase [Meiothermus sp.]MCS7057276.1 nucleoside hydrolase [Meiothermus sp.]MCS7193644.1 nucleoside hydrolase [Meiothermus sp.]MCX7740398.1 nucleoside hydrolase [Meiothermus sp.]MDW8091443.1 nucleoside hydrolase [Meiothermus sp.]MDW8481911.1 nucleoside hydrolase [Meiothermus sp.]
MPQKIILDCDPGHDDAIALMLALASPELEVLGITTVYGNVPLERTTHNALVVLEVLGKRVPVYPGAERPLVRDRISAEEVHGTSGLAGPLLPTPSQRPEALHAALFIVEQVEQHPGEVTLVPVGPLTNLALALRLKPQIAPKIRQIVLMGGSVDLGNWTPSAEFNILADPHAARIVFESGVPLTMMGLNLTHQAIAHPHWVARFQGLGNRAGAFAADLLAFFREHHQKRYGWDGAPIHDACTVAYLVRPGLFQTKRLHVAVETNEGLSFGRTVCDYWGVTGKTPNCQVGLRIDPEGFFELLLERIGSYP